MMKEQQIEKLATDLCVGMPMAICEYYVCETCPRDELAEHIYNLGYRKQVFGTWAPKEEMIRSITALNYTCSVCGAEGKHTAYCPNCGANMQGEETHQ